MCRRHSLNNNFIPVKTTMETVVRLYIETGLTKVQFSVLYVRDYRLVGLQRMPIRDGGFNFC